MRRDRVASTARGAPRPRRHRRLVHDALRRRLAALLVPVVAACGAASSREGVAVMASGADLESANPLVTIHPLARQVQRHVLLVTLARYDESLEPVPYLARTWRWSTDRRELVMTLYRGLRWHDGMPTTSRDAAFTIASARNAAVGSPRAADLATVDAVEAPDDSTLRLRFRAPQVAIPAVLCELPLVPAHLLGAVPPGAMRSTPFATAPTGNGPFRFVRRDAGQQWIFERNEQFPLELGGPPRLRRLAIAVVDEPATKLAGLVSGDLDVAGISPAMVALARRDPTLRIVEYPVLSSVAVIFNPRHPALVDRRVREAISLSLARERIITAAVGGLGTPAAGPVPPASPLALRNDSPLRDPGRADSLLDAAGWRRDPSGRRSRAGERLSLRLLTVGSGENAAEQLMQADLGERGIVVEIRQLEMGAFLAAARARPPAFDLLYTGIPGDLSLSHLVAMYDGRLRGGALDYADFHTPALDALLERTRNAGDAASLHAAWEGVQRELAREMPAAWIYHARGVQGVSRRLSGVTMDLRGELATVARWETGETRP